MGKRNNDYINIDTLECVLDPDKIESEVTK